MTRLRLSLLLLGSLFAACSPLTSKCKDGTLFVEVTITGAAINADQLWVDVALDGGAARHTELPHTAGAAAGGLQIEFPSGYPKGHSITVTLQAMKLGATLATATKTRTLTNACEHFDLALMGAPEPDLRMADLTFVPDLLPPPPDGADLAVEDLTAPRDEDLGAEDLAVSNDDLTVPPGSDLTASLVDLKPIQDLTVRDLKVPSAILQFHVGLGSPMPPNPDSFGTTNQDVQHTFTLENTGPGTSSPINVSIVGATNMFSIGTDGCTGQSLGASQACTVVVFFLAGQPNKMAGTWTASVFASATNGGSANNNIEGTAAYSWASSMNYTSHYTAGLGSSFTTTEPSGSCSTKGGITEVKYFDAPNGLQMEMVRSAGCDSSCGATSNWCFVSAPSKGLRECFGDTGQDYVFETGGRTGTYGFQQTCFPSGTTSPTYTNVVNTPAAPGVANVNGCDPSYKAMTRIFQCQ